MHKKIRSKIPIIKSDMYWELETHKDQQLLGCCIFPSCQNFPIYCQKCLESDNGNSHQKHKDYCKNFKDFIDLLQFQSDRLKKDRGNYFDLSFGLGSCRSLIKRTFFLQNQSIEEKIRKIENKIYEMDLKLFNKKSQFGKLLMHLRQEDYKQAANQIILIYQAICHSNQAQCFFQKIRQLVQNVENMQDQKFKTTNVSSLIEKSTYLFLARGSFIVLIKIKDQIMNFQSSSK